MIIDEFEYWEKLPQNFSDPWFKTLCHEVKFIITNWNIIRFIININYEYSIDI